MTINCEGRKVTRQEFRVTFHVSFAEAYCCLILIAPRRSFDVGSLAHATKAQTVLLALNGFLFRRWVTSNHMCGRIGCFKIASEPAAVKIY